MLKVLNPAIVKTLETIDVAREWLKRGWCKNGAESFDHVLNVPQMCLGMAILKAEQLNHVAGIGSSPVTMGLNQYLSEKHGYGSIVEFNDSEIRTKLDVLYMLDEYREYVSRDL